MKKALCVMTILLLGILAAPCSAQAYDEDSAETAGSVGTAVVMGVENAYETSVVGRIQGRAGAATITGAKGICFEVIYSDLRNIANILENPGEGLRTRLSLSSTDPEADLITTNKLGEIVRWYQCKDGESPAQVSTVIKQIKSGKYDSVRIVGTRELATLCREKAVAEGISLPMIDSGVSTNTTAKIANKALGIVPSRAQVFSVASKNSAVGVVVGSCLSIGESIYQGNTVCEAAGNLVEDGAVSAAATVLATVAEAELPALLASCGMSAVAASAATTVAVVVVPIVGGFVFDYLADEYQLEEAVIVAMEDVAAAASVAYQDADTIIVQLDIPGKVNAAWESLSKAGSNIQTSALVLMADIASE